MTFFVRILVSLSVTYVMLKKTDIESYLDFNVGPGIKPASDIFIMFAICCFISDQEFVNTKSVKVHRHYTEPRQKHLASNKYYRKERNFNFLKRKKKSQTICER